MSVLLDDTVERCRKGGLRRTKALEDLLATLLEEDRPMMLNELVESPRLAESCNRTTVYRLLHRLTEHGIIRRLGLHERAAFFALILPGKHQDFLICTECGSIEPIQAPCPVHTLEDEIRTKSGYRNLYHELEFFGTCPACT